VPQAYAYTGTDRRGYLSYADLETQQTLIAEPGGTYGIRATEEGLAVPPQDGRWASAPDAPAPAPWLPPPSPPPPAAETSTEDSGETPEGGE
jgi:hypothetical protein